MPKIARFISLMCVLKFIVISEILKLFSFFLNLDFFPQLDQTDLGMPDRAYYMRALNDSAVQAYLKMMVDSAVLLGAPKERAESDMMEALKFEIALANVSKFNEKKLYAYTGVLIRKKQCTKLNNAICF